LPSDAPVLAFDASGPWLAASVAGHHGFEAMDRGQAERLMPFLDDLLARAGLGWHDLGGLAVGVGPGNFTGVRIAVAAARGLALGLGVPAWGITAFALLRQPDNHPDELVSLPAPRGMAQVQRFHAGQPQGAPVLIDPAAPPALPGAARVRGHAAAGIGAALGLPASPATLDDLPARLGACAEAARRAGPTGMRPAPLYVRPPDAAPPSEAPPALIG
jgi:tRNA threonylcarbamoyl adenosine modification protein YeaZ